ncbi:MAG: hypothetical protein IT383_08460 [Deltaproteobacteria bacterium]|nr:hypothetical protein [Deltaproteobacteria bacterium]
MADPPRSTARPKTKLGVIARLGERLSSDERAPYELSEHDDALLFDEPTADQVVPADRIPDAPKRDRKGEP